ncbi:MAG: hypothetical protein QOE88_1079, partial [Verrucomicrobiota bacterium]|nr:hypothetical protein [Verrucomicrobiota bacterium]
MLLSSPNFLTGYSQACEHGGSPGRAPFSNILHYGVQNNIHYRIESQRLEFANLQLIRIRAITRAFLPLFGQFRMVEKPAGLAD